MRYFSSEPCAYQAHTLRLNNILNHSCAHVDVRGQHWTSSSVALPLRFRDRVSHGAWSSPIHSARLGWSESPWDSPACTPLGTGVPDGITNPSRCVGSRKLNLGLLACTVNTSPTGPSPQPRYSTFLLISYWCQVLCLDHRWIHEPLATS